MQALEVTNPADDRPKSKLSRNGRPRLSAEPVGPSKQERRGLLSPHARFPHPKRSLHSQPVLLLKEWVAG